MAHHQIRLATLLVFGVVWNRTAAADPEPPAAADVDPEARRLSAEGTRQFGAGHYAEAIAAFKAAYDRTPAPTLLYNIAQAYRMQNACAEALDAYRRYLATDPAGKLREMAHELIGEMQACAEKQAQAPPPLPRTPAPTPAPAPGAGAPITIPLPPPPAPAPRHGRAQTVATIATGVAAGGLLATGGYFAWQAHQASNSVTSVFDNHQAWSGTAMIDESRGITDQRRAWGFGAAGLVMAGVATLLGLWR